MQLNERPSDQPNGQQIATQKHDEKEKSYLQGQEIVEGDAKKQGAKMTTGEDGNMDSEVDISAAQKMLSAVSGSLLTSFLGERLFALCWYLADLNT
jgi:hypothetical protein